MKVVPLPTSLSTLMVPPFLSTTTDRAMADPLTRSLSHLLRGGKKGSNILWRIASGIPPPVSAMLISTESSTRTVRIVIVPFFTRSFNSIGDQGVT